MWSQQARYFKEEEEDIEVSDVRGLFIRDLCKFLGDLYNEGNHEILGMNVNDDV